MAKKAETKAEVKTVKSTVTAKELRDMTHEELAKQLTDVRKDLADARRSHVAGELVNPRVIGKTRKTIARIQTLLAEKVTAKGKEDK